MDIKKLTEYQRKLSHLTRGEVDTLIKRYYSGDNCAILLKEYNIKTTAGLLTKTFPFIVAIGDKCPNCNIDMFITYTSRTNMKYSYREKEKIFCKTCDHIVGQYGIPCKCKTCEQQRYLDETRKQSLEKEYKAELDCFDIGEYSIKDRLYISALLRVALDEEMLDIGPLVKYKESFAPTLEYENKIISHLKNTSKIIFSPNTSHDNISIEDDTTSKYRPNNTIYRINATTAEYRESIESLISIDNIVDDIDNDIKLELWMEIGLHECLEFLYAKMDEYNMSNYYIGDKTIFSIKESLQYFSIAQVFNFIWGSVTGAAAYSKKPNITTKHAVNTIAGNILRRKEKAEAEGWEVKNYGRDYDYPQTKLSEIFFNSLLGIGNDGFTKPMCNIITESGTVQNSVSIG